MRSSQIGILILITSSIVHSPKLVLASNAKFKNEEGLVAILPPFNQNSISILWFVLFSYFASNFELACPYAQVYKLSFHKRGGLAQI